MDVAADGAQIERVVVRSVDVVVRGQVALGVHGFSQLGAGEHLHGLGVALFLGLLDERRVHVGGLEDLALGAGDEVQVGLDAFGLRGGGLLVAGLHLGDERVLQADVDLLGGRGGLEQAGDLVVALLLGGLGESGVLRGSAGLAADGGLQVLERGADFAGAEAVHVGGVFSGRGGGTYFHRWDSFSSIRSHLLLMRINLNKAIVARIVSTRKGIIDAVARFSQRSQRPPRRVRAIARRK